MNTALQEKRKEECVNLWQEAFGDSNEFISQFITNYYKEDYMLCIEENNEVVSMLHFIPFEHNGYRVAYLYAIATRINAQGKGFAKSLIYRAIKKAKEEGYRAVFTLPADERLKGFYTQFGFKGKFAVRFETSDGFDFGTGDSEKDFVMMLPLEEDFTISAYEIIVLKKTVCHN